jgi:hypothetical protein
MSFNTRLEGPTKPIDTRDPDDDDDDEEAGE